MMFPMRALPKRLKKDAIAEALCAVRFTCEESTSFPGIVLGKLAEFPEWRHFEKIRLPLSNIPIQIRLQDQSLRSEPAMELRERNGTRLIKIGDNVLSYHRVAPYPGWESFKPEIDRSVDFLFSAFQDLKATRLGLRYINIFTAEDHGINNVGQLNYSVQLSGDDLTDPQNLNYRKENSDTHVAQVRIASPEFVSAPIGKKVHALVDVDVYTQDDIEIDEAESAKAWIEAAHDIEKKEFFRLFTNQMWERLVEEN